MNSAEIRSLLLQGSAEIVREYIDLAAAPPENGLELDKHYKARDTLLKFAIDQADKAHDIKKLDIDNARTVLDLLRNGDVTLPEAERLIVLLKTEADISLAPKLLEAAQDILQNS